MIATLEELAEHSKAWAQWGQRFYEPAWIKPVGCPWWEVAWLRFRMPELPQSYLQVARRYQLNGRCIGCFELSPGRLHKSLACNLIDWNRPKANPHWDQVLEHGARFVASNEAEPIAVVCTPAKHVVGEVLMFDHDLPAKEPVVIAADFETFMLAAGNAYALFYEYRDTNLAAGLSEFLERLKVLGIANNPDSFRAWRQVGEVMFT